MMMGSDGWANGDRRWRLALGGVLLATAAAFAPVLQADFLNLDDYRYLTAVRPFNGQTIAHIFTHFFEGYHPLTLVSLGLTYAWAGFDPWTHHALNLVLHVVNTWLVYVLVATIWGRRGMACLAAAIFGLHPAHVEAVAWVTARKDVLYACFYLWAMIVYVGYARAGGRWRYAGCLVLFLLAVLSKGMAVSFPLAAVAIDYVLGRPLRARRVWIEKLPFLVLSVIFGLVSIRAQQASGYVPALDAVGTVAGRVALALQAVALYAWHLVNPLALAAFHPYPPPAEGRAWAVVGAVLSAGGAAAVVVGWRRARTAVFALLFVALSLVTVLQLVPVADFVVADRYLYLAVLGVAVALSALLTGETVRRRRTWGAALAVALLLTLGWASHAYASAWRTSVSVWSHTLVRHPGAAFVLNMRGGAYSDGGRYAEAVGDFDAAVAANPTYPRTYLNRGYVRDKLGDARGALEDYGRAIALAPRDALAYNNRARILLRQGDAAAALQDAEQALALAPGHPAVHLFLGNRAGAKLALRDWAGAEADASAAIARLPTHYVAHLTRAAARWQLGNQAGAEADVTRAEAIDPGDPAAAALRATWVK